jgi:N-acetylglucosaminyl-diphospho-decaprenol L-rhamnosyltransferase
MEDSQPILSVIVVAYRSRDEIAACVGSIPKRIDGRLVEVLVVDNSPGDGADNILQSTFPEVIYIACPENVGFGRANNRGFHRSNGEVVLFLNPDTICNEGALTHCIHRVLTEQELGLISPKLVMANGEIDAACRRSIPSFWDGFCRASGLSARFPRSPWLARYNLSYLDEGGTYSVGAINGAFMMAKRSVLDDVGLFDETFFMYGDDLDLCIRMSRAGYQVVYDGRVQIVHLKGTSVSKDYESMSQAIFDANRDVFLKHYNPQKRKLIQWSYVAAFGVWKCVARFRARLRKSRRVRPV